MHYTLEKKDSNHWQYEQLESKKLDLFYYPEEGSWDFTEYYWNGSEWEYVTSYPAVNESAIGNPDATYLQLGYDPAYATATRQLMKSGKLALEESLSGKADKAVPSAAGNLASLAAQGNLADSGVKPSDLAAKADLPYRLVEPGKWEFSPPTYQGQTLELDWRNGTWTVLVNGTEFGVYPTGDENALELSFTMDVRYTAARSSLPGHLFDRAVNKVDATGTTELTLPALEHAGKAREFLVKVTTSVDDLHITWQGQGSEASGGADELQFVTENGNFPVVGTHGNYLF